MQSTKKNFYNFSNRRLIFIFVCLFFMFVSNNTYANRTYCFDPPLDEDEKNNSDKITNEPPSMFIDNELFPNENRVYSNAINVRLKRFLSKLKPSTMRKIIRKKLMDSYGSEGYNDISICKPNPTQYSSASQAGITVHYKVCKQYHKLGKCEISHNHPYYASTRCQNFFNDPTINKGSIEFNRSPKKNIKYGCELPIKGLYPSLYFYKNYLYLNLFLSFKEWSLPIEIDPNDRTYGSKICLYFNRCTIHLYHGKLTLEPRFYLAKSEYMGVHYLQYDKMNKDFNYAYPDTEGCGTDFCVCNVAVDDPEEYIYPYAKKAIDDTTFQPLACKSCKKHTDCRNGFICAKLGVYHSDEEYTSWSDKYCVASNWLSSIPSNYPKFGGKEGNDKINIVDYVKDTSFQPIKENNAYICEPNLLKIDKKIELLRGFGSLLQWPTSLYLFAGVAGDHSLENNGTLQIATKVGLMSMKSSPYALNADSDKPTYNSNYNTQMKSLENNMMRNGYDIALNLNNDLLNNLLWQLWSATGFSFSIDASDVSLLNVTDIGDYLGLKLLKDLSIEKAPMRVVTYVRSRPRVEFSGQSVNPNINSTNSSNRSFTVKLLIPDFILEMLAYVKGSWTHLFNIKLNLSIAVNIKINNQNGLEFDIKSLEDTLIDESSIEIVDASPFVPEPSKLTKTTKRFYALVKKIIIPKLEKFIGDFKNEYNGCKIPEIKGIGISPAEFSYQNSGVHIIFRIDKFEPSLSLTEFQDDDSSINTITVKTKIENYLIDKEYSDEVGNQYILKLNLNFFDVKEPDEDGYPISENVEFSYRIDGRLWSNFTETNGKNIVISDTSLNFEGDHLLEVRARHIDSPLSLSKTIDTVKVHIDQSPPIISVNGKQVSVSDKLSPDTLVVKYQIINKNNKVIKDWESIASTEEIDLDQATKSMHGPVTVTVVADDGNKNVAKTHIRLKLPEQDSSETSSDSYSWQSEGCSSSGHDFKSSLATLILVLLNLIFFKIYNGSRISLRKGFFFSFFAFFSIGCGIGWPDRNIFSPDEQNTFSYVNEPTPSELAKCSQACGSDMNAYIGTDNSCICEQIGCELSYCQEICGTHMTAVCVGDECVCSDNSCKLSQCQCSPEQVPKCDAGVCKCKTLKRLDIGEIGGPVSIAESPTGIVAVAAYNKTYGDLMLKFFTSKSEFDSHKWIFVDGVPNSYPQYQKDVRNGTDKKGQDAGKYNDIAIDSNNVAHIVYQKDGQLMYARVDANINKSSPNTFSELKPSIETFSLRGNGSGFWPQIVIAGSTVHVVETEVSQADSSIKYFKFSSSTTPQSLSKLSPKTLASKNINPVPSQCNENGKGGCQNKKAVCFLEFNLCQDEDPNCKQCGPNEICVSGQCQPQPRCNGIDFANEACAANQKCIKVTSNSHLNDKGKCMKTSNDCEFGCTKIMACINGTCRTKSNIDACTKAQNASGKYASISYLDSINGSGYQDPSCRVPTDDCEIPCAKDEACYFGLCQRKYMESGFPKFYAMNTILQANIHDQIIITYLDGFTGKAGLIQSLDKLSISNNKFVINDPSYFIKYGAEYYYKQIGNIFPSDPFSSNYFNFISINSKGQIFYSASLIYNEADSSKYKFYRTLQDKNNANSLNYDLNQLGLSINSQKVVTASHVYQSPRLFFSRYTMLTNNDLKLYYPSGSLISSQSNTEAKGRIIEYDAFQLPSQKHIWTAYEYISKSGKRRKIGVHKFIP